MMLNQNERSSFDSLLQIAIHEELTYLDPELQALLKETENDDLPPEVDAYLLDFAKKKRKTDAKIQRRRKLPRYIRNAAIFIFGVALSFSALYGNVEAFKVGVDNVYFSFREGVYELILHNDSVLQGNIPFPEYMTSGLELEYSKSGPNITQMRFSSEAFWVDCEIRTLISTNYHDVGPDKSFNAFVNGNPAKISTNGGDICIVWFNDTYLFTLSTNLDEKELLKIAESIPSL